MAILEGKGLEGGVQKLETCFIPSAITGTLFWWVAFFNWAVTLACIELHSVLVGCLFQLGCHIGFY
jgi:hypothetical protein